MTAMLTDLNSAVNIIFALIMAGAGIALMRVTRRPWSLIFVLLGLYWAGFYTFALLFDYTDAAAIGQTFVRPAMTVTYASITVLLILLGKLWTYRKA
jgi:hypothetical protein